MKKAWIFQGGWDGHEPKLTSKRFARLMEKHGISRITARRALDELESKGLIYRKRGIGCFVSRTAYENMNETAFFLPMLTTAEDGRRASCMPSCSPLT